MGHRGKTAARNPHAHPNAARLRGLHAEGRRNSVRRTARPRKTHRPRASNSRPSIQILSQGVSGNRSLIILFGSLGRFWWVRFMGRGFEGINEQTPFGMWPVPEGVRPRRTNSTRRIERNCIAKMRRRCADSPPSFALISAAANSYSRLLPASIDLPTGCIREHRLRPMCGIHRGPSPKTLFD